MALDLGSTGLISYRHAFRQQPWPSRSQNASDTMCYNERTLTRDKIEYLITGVLKITPKSPRKYGLVSFHGPRIDPTLFSLVMRQNTHMWCDSQICHSVDIPTS